MTGVVERLQLALAPRYAIQRELGRGGMAIVYLAHDHQHERSVAFKVLRPELAWALGAERFLREIRFAAQLQHPHILTVLDSGQVAGEPPLLWFTMPWVDGESLRARLDRAPQLPVDEALQITREAALALDYAHRHGVIHRDIKPENILLSEGQALVADFGIGKALDAPDGEYVTATGLSLGTPAYMSPEQAAGESALDGRTDQYSLATVLYEMLAGEVPFAAPSAQAMLARRLIETPRPLHAVRPTVPAWLDAVVRRALEPVAADRFPAMADFARALASGSPGAANAAPPLLERTIVAFLSRRRIAPALMGLGLGVVLALGVLFVWQRHRSTSGGAGPPRLAVLPFQNLGDTSRAYFAAGMTDAIRGKLTGLEGLRVIARTSSDPYAHTTKALTQIGSELGVRYLLTGTVLWEARADTTRVEVDPELIDARDATTRWQEPFDAALTDVFAVQGEIAARVAGALDVALGDSVERTLSAPPTRNPAAYDAYLRGEALGLSDEPATLRRAVSDYQRAVTLDSTFALAWADLSRAQSLLFAQGVQEPAVVHAAQRAAVTALRLDPDGAEGHDAMGLCDLVVLDSVAAAVREYNVALRRSPDDPALLRGLGAAEEHAGQWDSAVVHKERAAQLDPRSAKVFRGLGEVLLEVRRFPEARAALDHALALAPDDHSTIVYRVLVAVDDGDLAEARALLRATPSTADRASLVAYLATYANVYWVLDDSDRHLLLGLGPAAFDGRGDWALVRTEMYRLLGDTLRARVYADSARLEFGRQLAAQPNVFSRVQMALALAYLGRKDEALRVGEAAAAEVPISQDAEFGVFVRQQLLLIELLCGENQRALDRLAALLRVPSEISPGRLRIDPMFAPLRGDPRFQRMVSGG